MATQQLYQIEKNVPLQSRYGRPEGEMRKLANAMGGGDSVLFVKPNEAKYLCAIISASGHKAVMRTMVDGSGVRVWKMKKETKKGSK